jgi:phosphoglycolate phosphatase-like HAD superfamily hydrolase
VSETDTVVLFDVDNTLLDNDRVIADIGAYLEQNFNLMVRDRYWEIFEELRGSLGYADYLGTLERYRLEAMHDPRALRMANWLIDYPFADRLYAQALQAVTRAKHWGTPVILSDGDAVFQPRKVQRSGLWHAFGESNVLIYVHKEQELAEVERLFPAKRYVMVDDKLRILTAMKKIWGDRLVTIFPRQGHYALDVAAIAQYPPADITVEHIGELMHIDLPPM